MIGEKKRGNRISVVVEDELKDAIIKWAKINKRSMSDFLRLVAIEYIEAQEADDDEDEA